MALDRVRDYDLSLSGGQLILPFDGSPGSLELRLVEEGKRA
jgi:hypothetical protein